MRQLYLEFGGTVTNLIRKADRKLLKALHRQASRLLSVLDRLDATVPLSTMERLRLEEVERAILYIKAHRGWLDPTLSTLQQLPPANGKEA